MIIGDVTRVVHVPYVVEQDEDGVWCACAALCPGVAAFGDGQARMIGASGAPFTGSDFDPVPDRLGHGPG